MANQSWPVLDAPNSTYLWTQLLVEEFVRNGVKTFFVAPGSRSTPLTVAVARHPEAESVLHVDERGGAFAALGVGRATQTPAAWITTSGTAVANGLPAAVEASVDGVPLLFLTADRPPELRDTGANQTIDQAKIFGDYVRWHVDVPPPSDDIDPAYVLTTADQALHRAVRAPAGPVHVNCMFRKPLEPVEEEASIGIPPAVEEWAMGTEPYTRYPTPVPSPSGPDTEALAELLRDTQRGLVVAGRLDTDAAADAVQRLAMHLGWPLIPDLTSRLRLGGEEGTGHVPYGDLVLTSDAFREAHPPEAVLQVGGRFASKRLRGFLRDSAPEAWAVIRRSPSRIDPDHRITHHVEADISSFADGLITRLPEGGGTTTWRDDWTDASDRASAVVNTHARDQNTLTEPLVATILTEERPTDHALVAASSMPVRDLNRHAAPTGGSAGPVYANRGVSGIDGTVATAAGVAHGRGGPVTLLIGDLALWHDLNGLALLQELSVVVIVVNNDGGGIFHFLPIREHDEFDPYFTTPHGRDFEDAAALFDLPYHRPDSPLAFRSAYVQACQSGESALIEVQTDRTANRRVHEQLETAVADAVERGGSREAEK